MPKAVIFDFDGTIADSAAIFLESLMVAIGRKHDFTNKEIAELRNSSTKEIIHKLGVKKWQLPLVLIRGRSEITKRMYRVSPFEGIPEVLEELSKSDIQIYILSTNAEKNIGEFLKKYNLEQFVDHLYADIGLFGKVKWLKKLMKREDLSANQCIYVGDETRDIEAAHKVGMKCIAVSWGYSNPGALEKLEPSNLVKNPQNLISAVGLLTSNRS